MVNNNNKKTNILSRTGGLISNKFIRVYPRSKVNDYRIIGPLVLQNNVDVSFKY